MIYKVKKKPLEFEAMQYTGTDDNIVQLQEWSNYQVWRQRDVDLSNSDSKMLMVQCLEALAETSIGSFVVKGIKGEVWPVREDIFYETYDYSHDGIK